MSSGKEKPRVRWDEDNLIENEKVKQELNPTKIDEPKTPYHSPGSDLDLELEDYQKQLENELAREGFGPKTNESEDTQKPVPRVSFDESIHHPSASMELVNESDFSERRRQHYIMKGVLQKGSSTLTKQEEE